MNLDALKQSVRERARLAFLSFLFFIGTTLISVLIVWLPSFWNPKAKLSFNLGSTIIGSFMGQITLLMAMSMISEIFRREREDIAKEIIEGIDKLNEDEE